jgi:hypothetical protein
MDKSLAPERWLPVVGFEGVYEVSDHGRVRSLDRVATGLNGVRRPISGRVLRGSVSVRGYYRVSLSWDGRQEWPQVSRLVLAAFVGACPAGQQAAHGDGKPWNNHVSNLRWATPKANTADKVIHGTMLYGETHWHAQVSEADVVAMRMAYDGTNRVELAAEYGIGNGCLTKILCGETWGHLEPPAAPYLLEQRAGGGRVTVTERDVKLMRVEYDGRNSTKLARRYGVTKPVVDGIVYGNKWRSVVPTIAPWFFAQLILREMKGDPNELMDLRLASARLS